MATKEATKEFGFVDISESIDKLDMKKYSKMPTKYKKYLVSTRLKKKLNDANKTEIVRLQHIYRFPNDYGVFVSKDTNLLNNERYPFTLQIIAWISNYFLYISGKEQYDTRNEINARTKKILEM